MANVKRYPFDDLKADGDYFEVPIDRFAACRLAAYTYCKRRPDLDWRISVETTGGVATATRVPKNYYCGRGTRKVGVELTA